MIAPACGTGRHQLMSTSLRLACRHFFPERQEGFARLETQRDRDAQWNHIAVVLASEREPASSEAPQLHLAAAAADQQSTIGREIDGIDEMSVPAERLHKIPRP